MKYTILAMLLSALAMGQTVEYKLFPILTPCHIAGAASPGDPTCDVEPGVLAYVRLLGDAGPIKPDAYRVTVRYVDASGKDRAETKLIGRQNQDGGWTTVAMRIGNITKVRVTGIKVETLYITATGERETGITSGGTIPLEPL